MVFGRHGAYDTFSLEFVHAAVRSVLEERDDVWFVFLNTAAFHRHERVIYLEPVEDRRAIRRFVNTCDYMLHARGDGEGFGLAIAEFAGAGVPVLTYLGSPKRAHLDLLSDGLCLGYRGPEDVAELLRKLQRRESPVRSDIVERFSVSNVMARFERVFLW